MDPATAVPLHFTIESLGLGAAGLLLASATLLRHPVAAAGALVFGVGQLLVAGQFVSGGTTGWTAAGMAGAAGLLAVAVESRDHDDRFLAWSSAGVGIAALLWRTSSSGVLNVPWPQRVVAFAAFLALAVCAWRRAADGVRPRLVTAFVAVLAITVIVGGGAVARVGAEDAVNDGRRTVEQAAQRATERITLEADQLVRRAAIVSTVAGPAVASDDLGVAQRLGTSLSDVGFVLVNEAGEVVWPRHSEGAVHGKFAAARDALRGRTATGLISTPTLQVAAGAPIFVGGQRPEDVIGAVVLTTDVPQREIEAIVAAGLDVSVTTDDGDTLRGERFDDHFITSSSQPSLTEAPRVTLTVARSLQDVVGRAGELPRALVGGILAAALLAVIVALWMSARVARPIVDLADEAERLKTDFLTNLSHELRTPLTPIRGYTELLRRDRPAPRRTAGYIDEIGDAAGRLERIITLLLDVAAMEAGRFAVKTADVGVPPLLAAAAARSAPRSRRHTIHVDAPEPLPPVDVDERALGRVLDELLDNAVKFSPDGGTIELRARRVDDGVEISVSDSGVGIDPEKAEALSQAFAQAESGDTRRFGGLGLGLAYVGGVLAAHGSRLDIDSAPGRGTTASFTLPTASMVTPMPAEASRRKSTSSAKRRA